VSIDADLDTLYGVPPEEFTALRKELAAAAKKRGDSEAATTIAAARRPTAAAWVVNRLIRTDDTVRSRLSDLTADLRAAHATMDGPRIRELTGVQRTLIAELVRASFTAADLSDPSAGMRADVTGTLQAAIADPEVAARLGRLEKAEQFSGFGDFGEVAEARSTPAKPAKTPPAKTPANPEPIPEPKASAGELRAARKRRDGAAKADAAAKSASVEAAEILGDAEGHAATARRRYEKILHSLAAAEREIDLATVELETAQGSASAAAESALAAAAELAAAEGALSDLAD
jgi:hypothetical protein